MTAIFGVLATPFGYLMQGLYNLFNNYGLTIIVFTFLVRLIMLPLKIKQQKSAAKQSVYQPMIAEIQSKWKNDKQRQQKELMKLQEETGMKMTPGCLPMILDMLVMLSIIQVIYMPLKYILHLNEEAITAGIEALKATGVTNITNYTGHSHLIGAILSGVQSVKDAVFAIDPHTLTTIEAFNFDFLGLNLAIVPDLKLQSAGIQYLILPILSIATMFASQVIIMKTTQTPGGPQQGKGMMWGMTIFMGIMFGTFAFTVPVGFSLYYTTSNVVMTIVQLIVRKIINPEKIKQEMLDELEEKRKEKKAKKKIEITDEKGELVEKEVTEAELVKIRLAKARELDKMKYGDHEEMSEEEAALAEKARKADDDRYGKVREDKLEAALATREKKKAKNKAQQEEKEAEPEETLAIEESHEEKPEEKVLLKIEDENEQDKAEYRPGRRMRSRQKLKSINTENNEEDNESEKE